MAEIDDEIDVLLAIDGLAVSQILAHCREAYGALAAIDDGDRRDARDLPRELAETDVVESLHPLSSITTLGNWQTSASVPSTTDQGSPAD